MSHVNQDVKGAFVRIQLAPPEKKKSACVRSEINRHGLDIKRKVKEAIHAARQGLGIQRFCSRQSALKLCGS